MAATGSSSNLVTVLVAFIGVAGTLGGIWLAHRLNQVHTLVNSQFTAALKRITALEPKLGLTPGEAIPAAQVVTAATGEGSEGPEVLNP